MILIVTAVFPPEPVVSANLSFDIANALAAEEKVVVISPPPTRPFGMTFDKDIMSKEYPFEHIVLDTYTCPESKLLGRIKESYSLGVATKKYIEENHQKIEVIYANTWPLFAQKYLTESASKYNIPLVLHIQDIYPESISEKLPFVGLLINKLLLPIDEKILKNSTKIVTISYKMRDYLIESRHLKEDKISVVRNWQDDDIFINFKDKNQSQKNELFTFMYLGSISPTAGVDLLIHAFGKSDLKDARLIIAGGGSDKEKCMAIAQGYHDKEIQFYEVSGNEVPGMQAKADVLMLPLKRGVAKTALPSKLTAYMLSAKPIIASIDTDSEPADLIQDNDCGYVVEPEDEQKLIHCMREISQKSCDELSKMGEKSFSYAKEHLSRKHNLSKLMMIILDTKREVV
ncbi:glycosyltransferase family 4 protein [Sulfurovum sp. CS9]|uniref:glycosyltransferase family 4 protein n=1 Tax=Sulfurovum sp. CS9 TaxID=3391146 RepID=UPI0039E9F695